MDRMDEYYALQKELEDAPPALEFTVQRARARARRRRRVGRGVGIPLGSLAAVFAVFVLLVNVSAPFALACARLPFWKDLAAAVSFSPSLKAAVEHDYVQYLGLEQTDGGVTMRIEHVIVDQKQVNIFYTLTSETYEYLEGREELLDAGGQRVRAASTWPGPVRDQSELNCITVDFMDQNVPDTLRLDYGAWPFRGWDEDRPQEAPERAGDPWPDTEPEPEPEPVARFSFTLRFDPKYTEQGEVIALGQWLELDGQRVYAEDVEVFPTHIRLNLSDDPANTAWLKGLEFYLEDENGSRYEKIASGITATGDPEGTPFYPSHRLESSYFGDAAHLTLCITGAEWLDKGSERATLHLDTGEARGLPEGVSLLSAERAGDNVRLAFRAPIRDFGATYYQVFSTEYYDPEGGGHTTGGYATDTARTDEDGVEIAGSFEIRFTLEDYPWDTVELGLISNRVTVFDAPVTLEVK